MAGVNQQSPLFKKYGAKLDSAVKKTRANPVEYGPIQLPPGILNGVAKLVECKFDIYKSGPNKGEYYFRAAGVVLEPNEVIYKGTKVPVKGQQTSIMEAVCDTKTQKGKVTTQEEHIDNILNEMKKLAGQEFVEGATGADLESLAAALKEAGPFFRFSTSPKTDQKTGEVTGAWENWHGGKGLEDYSSPDDSGAVEDHTGDKEEETLAEEEAPADEEPVATDEPDVVSMSLLELASAAFGTDGTDGSAEAAEALQAKALEAGLTEEDVTNADSWDALVEQIEAASTPAEEPEPEEEKADPKNPVVGNIFFFKAPGKDGKPGKAAEVEVLTLDKRMKTCTVKSLDTNRPILDMKTKKPLVVKWVQLETQ